MGQALPHLGGRTAAEFLSQYWQKRPLLIRNAFPGWQNPLTPEELAGLALEPDVQSRIVRETHGTPPWEQRSGPFDEADFTTLPETDWTLLVQGVNHHIPEVAALLERFRFIPNWRLDDIMVSYAAPGGSVGPHTDRYDVFLIQGYGRRRWSIAPPGPVTLIDGIELQVIDGFVPTMEWELEPGDMLYLPPDVPHHGVALDACMTYSVGFRAPTDQELMAAFFEHAVASADPDARYHDPDLTPPASPGRISPDALSAIRAAIRRAVADDRALDHWFGAHITTPVVETEPDPDAPDWPAIADHLAGGGELVRPGWSRWAYLSDDRETTLYVNGVAYPAPATGLAALLCNGGPLDRGSLAAYLGRAGCGELLAELVRNGALESA